MLINSNNISITYLSRHIQYHSSIILNLRYITIAVHNAEDLTSNEKQDIVTLLNDDDKILEIKNAEQSKKKFKHWNIITTRKTNFKNATKIFEKN